MKKILIRVLLISFMLPLVALTGTVIETTGKVEIETDSGWKALQVGDTVDTGRIISTGFRSKAIIQVAGSNVTVNQLTRLSLEQLSETSDAHETEVYLDLGSIAANVKTSENKRVGFVVNTPVATASVRGTSFDMDLNTLSVSSGLVSYSGSNEVEMPVARGKSSIITQNGESAKPVETKIAASLGKTVTDEPLQSIADVADTAIKQKEDKEAKAAYFNIVVR